MGAGEGEFDILQHPTLCDTHPQAQRWLDAPSPVWHFKSMRARLPLLLLVAPFVLLLLAGGNCAPRACENESHCFRECECTDTSRDISFNCGMNFLCSDEGFCEDSFNMTCDEFCSQFAARGVCYSRRCDDERDCDRYTPCQAYDEATQQTTTFDCSRRFSCNQEAGACDADFASMTNDQMCQQYDQCVFAPTVD